MYSFKDLFYHHFMQGVPIRRKGWNGYWIRKDFGTIEIHNTATGEVVSLTDRDDIIFILENTLKEDWEIAEDVLLSNV